MSLKAYWLLKYRRQDWVQKFDYIFISLDYYKREASQIPLHVGGSSGIVILLASQDLEWLRGAITCEDMQWFSGLLIYYQISIEYYFSTCLAFITFKTWFELSGHPRLV